MKEDLESECAKQGPVVSCIIPRGGPAGQGHYGKAFVQFSDPAHAVKARDTIHGRVFDGNKLVATLIAEIPPDAQPAA